MDPFKNNNTKDQAQQSSGRIMSAEELRAVCIEAGADDVGFVETQNLFKSQDYYIYRKKNESGKHQEPVCFCSKL
jgi:hypothetical protein